MGFGGDAVKALTLFGVLVLVSVAADASVIDTGDACSPPPAGVRYGELDAGAECAFGTDCSSLLCLPAEKGTYCAGEPLAGSCERVGDGGWVAAYVQDCSGGDCNRAIAPYCVRPGPSPVACGPRCEADASCWQNGDCASGACLLPSTFGPGVCIDSCRAPGTLSLTDPHLCSPGTAHTCVEERDSRQAWCLPAAPGAQVLDVDLFGAACVATPADGQFDSGPAINLALAAAEDGAGQGQVCLRGCNYFIDENLVIGSETTLFGQGETSTLFRGNTLDHSPLCVAGDPCDACSENHFGQFVISNRGYNCGNVGIELRDFAIDGSLVNPTFTSDDTLRPMATVAFSSVKDTRVENLLIRNAPQDAIFFRNGGVDSEVVNNTIDGFNMRWFNGAGINVEMHANGNLVPHGHTASDAQIANLRIEGNTIIARSPRWYCSLHQMDCETDADCRTGQTCTQTRQVDAINVNVTEWFFSDLDLDDDRVDFSGKSFPKPTIEDNTIVTNGSPAIRCFGCTDTTVARNCLAPLLPGADPDAVAHGCRTCLEDPRACSDIGTSNSSTPFTGIYMAQLSQTEMVEPALGNFTVAGNRLFGGGGGHAIWINSRAPKAAGVSITGNTIQNWFASWDPNGQAAIDVRGHSGVEVIGNQISGACRPDDLETPCAGLEIGGIHVNSRDNALASDAAILENIVRDKKLHPAGKGIYVRRFNQPASPGPSAFSVLGNQLYCLGSGDGLLVGDPAPSSPMTSNGVVSGNKMRLDGNTGVKCHPDISAQGRLAIDCAAACDVTLSSNDLIPATVDSSGCSVVCNP